MKEDSPQEHHCPFCAIASHDDEDAREVYRDSNIVAFFPTEPVVLGHTLIIPKRHAPNIWSITQDEAASIGRVSILIANAIRSAMNPHGLNVIQSNGTAASQTVFHYHTHLVPRWENDAIGQIWPPESNYTERQKDEAHTQLRSNILRYLAS